MSWDIFVQDIPAAARSVADIPDDFAPKPIGTRSEIIQKIKSVVPSADFSDPAWGKIDSGDYSIEINMGESETLDSFAFHVRGSPAAVSTIAAILQHLGLRAFDTQSDTGIFDASAAMESFKRWKTYREQIAK